MRLLMLTAAAGAVLTTAACDGRVAVRSDRNDLSGRTETSEFRTIARLDCPEREGDLQRILAAEDGRSCTYAGANGAEVVLALEPLEGRPAKTVLDVYRGDLEPLIPEAEADTVEEVVQIADTADGDRARIRLPGVSIDAQGDRANVRVGNVIDIDADDRRGTVRIRDDKGDVNIRAQDDRAEIDVDAGHDGDVRSTYIVTTDAPASEGWRLVGFEARGPEAGPLVVATVKVKSRRGDDAVDGMKDLVERNVGG